MKIKKLLDYYENQMYLKDFDESPEVFFRESSLEEVEEVIIFDKILNSIHGESDEIK